MEAFPQPAGCRGSGSTRCSTWAAHFSSSPPLLGTGYTVRACARCRAGSCRVVPASPSDCRPRASCSAADLCWRPLCCTHTGAEEVPAGGLVTGIGRVHGQLVAIAGELGSPVGGEVGRPRARATPSRARLHQGQLPWAHFRHHPLTTQSAAPPPTPRPPQQTTPP